MDPFSAAGDVFTTSPLYAFVPAFGFLCAWYLVRSRLVIGVATVWALYAVYEQLMKARILCSGECDIRIDLLAIYPALLILSAAALIAIVVRVGRRTEH